MTQKQIYYSWIKPNVKAYYTNTSLMPVLCYVHSECEDNTDNVHIYRGDRTGIIAKSKLHKHYKDADKRIKL
jgi:hypothetical protein